MGPPTKCSNSSAAWTLGPAIGGRPRGSLNGSLADHSAERRVVRINGEAASSANGLVDYLDVVWLTPQMDRLFVEGLSTRRRFMDRLVYIALYVADRPTLRSAAWAIGVAVSIALFFA